MDEKTRKTPSKPRRGRLLVFQVADQHYGVSSPDVEQITPMPQLHHPPGMPQVLAGFLDLAGEPIPVLRLRHLFGQPDVAIGLWTPIIILRRTSQRLALLVDKVQHILAIDGEAILPLPPGHVLNNCIDGVVRAAADSVLLLSPERLLLRQEARSVAELQQLEQQRLKDLEEVKV